MIESAMIPALEDLTRVEEVVRVPGLGFLDKTAAEKLSEIFQVLILISCWCMYVLSKGTHQIEFCIVLFTLCSKVVKKGSVKTKLVLQKQTVYFPKRCKS